MWLVCVRKYLVNSLFNFSFSFSFAPCVCTLSKLYIWFLVNHFQVHTEQNTRERRERWDTHRHINITKQYARQGWERNKGARKRRRTKNYALFSSFREILFYCFFFLVRARETIFFARCRPASLLCVLSVCCVFVIFRLFVCRHYVFFIFSLFAPSLARYICRELVFICFKSKFVWATGASARSFAHKYIYT